MIEKIHIIVALFAALAITILSLYQDVTFYELSKRLVVVIPAFFIFGLFFRSYLKKTFTTPFEKPEDNEKNDKTDYGIGGDASGDSNAEADLYDTDDSSI